MRLSMTKAMLAALVLAAPTTPLRAFEPQNVECIAPASPGGGWDFTCRQVGKVLYGEKMTPGPVQVTNRSGASGAVAFAEIIAKRNTDDNLIAAASTATSTRLAQGQYAGFTAADVRWLGAVGADYGVIAVGKDSPHKTLAELIGVLKTEPTRISVSGGSSVGGWDHLKMLTVARAAGIANLRSIKYVAFQSGGEAVTQLIGGHVQAFSGDISEVLGFMEAGELRVLAVLAPERLPGDLGNLPTAREQGVDAVGVNWRGFYGPGKMTDDAYNYWSKAIADLYASAEWKKIMADNGLIPFGMTGPELTDFVKQQVADMQSLSREIGLIK